MEIRWSQTISRNTSHWKSFPDNLVFHNKFVNERKNRVVERFSIHWLSVDQQTNLSPYLCFFVFRCSLHPSAIYTHASKRYSHARMSKYVYLHLVCILFCPFHLHTSDVKRWRISSTFFFTVHISHHYNHQLWSTRNPYDHHSYVCLVRMSKCIHMKNIQTCLISISMYIQEQNRIEMERSLEKSMRILHISWLTPPDACVCVILAVTLKLIKVTDIRTMSNQSRKCNYDR